MGAKKAAAGLSTAGLVFIAGCGGGGGHPSGISVPPPVPPQNAKKLSISFSLPLSAPSYLTVPPRPSAFGKNAKRNAQSYRATPKYVRKPNFIGFSVIGGHILLDIYQNGQLATYQSLTVGFGSPYDLNCVEAPPTYFSLTCTNSTTIYAPGGSDTFYAATYDSQNRLISLTPGFPGSNVSGTPPAPVTIPSSSAVQIQTYGVPATIYIDESTPCVASANASFHVADIAGDLMTGPLAYPITITTTGGFYTQYSGTSLGSTSTLYSAGFSYAFGSASSGQTGAITAQTSAGNLSVSFPTLYSVDETGFVAQAGGGLYAIGLVNGSASSFACGQVQLTSLYTGQPLTFTNPVGMSQDGGNSIVVLDDAGANPTVDVILSNGLFIGPSKVPVVQTTLSSTGGDDIAATANLQAYVLNSDGSIHRVDYSLAALYPFMYATVPDTQIASSLIAPAASSIGALAYNLDDYVFASSYGSSMLYEIDGANLSSPFVTSQNIGTMFEGPDENFSGSEITTAVVTDATNLYATFRVWDSGQASTWRNAVIGCSLNNTIPCIFDLFANSVPGGNFGGAGTLAAIPSVPALLATSANSVVGIYEQNSGSSFAFETTGASLNRIVTSPDGSFVGVQQGTSFYFAPTNTATPVGSLTGNVSTIWNSPFF